MTLVPLVLRNLYHSTSIGVPLPEAKCPLLSGFSCPGGGGRTGQGGGHSTSQHRGNRHLKAVGSEFIEVGLHLHHRLFK